MLFLTGIPAPNGYIIQSVEAKLDLGAIGLKKRFQFWNKGPIADLIYISKRMCFLTRWKGC